VRNDVIDSEGFRANVAIVLVNADGRVFWGKRRKQGSWQFPQGGLNNNESALMAMYRELYEEVGLYPQDVEIIAATDQWFRYKLPGRYLGQKNINCIGQKQKWFLLRLLSPIDRINLEATILPEFDTFTWIYHWVASREVIAFKKAVYEKALNFFSPMIKRMVRKSNKKKKLKAQISSSETPNTEDQDGGS
jgi:putative (di)nucleoside polyphosphate hydrolase